MAAPVCSIKKHFRKLKDPRVVGRAKHRLVDLIVIALCAVIANSDDWPDISVFARKRIDWFRRFLALPGGIPSHDTFERVFAALDHRVFERCCLDWLREVAQLVGVGHIAIDGKTLRGSASSKLGPLHLVSAWATGAQVSLGQVAVDGKSNEIDAIPKLLELLDLNGALVTIDAIGCQKKIAKQIVEGGGDYVRPVKGNQERLQQDIQQTVGRALEGELAKGATASYTSVEQGHGRCEERSCVIVTDLSDLRDRAKWHGVKVVGMIRRERTVDGRTTTEVCYFIGSRRMGARSYAQVLRNHWGIENHQHWQLDISFREDESRIENRHGAANFALLRKLALSLLKQHPKKESIKRKRKLAALDPSFLAETLAGPGNLDGF